MIIETRRWQFVLFVFGLMCIFFSINTFINPSGIYANIRMKEISELYYYFNQVVLTLLLVSIGLMGCAFISIVIYSIKKCQEFRTFDKKVKDTD